MLVMALTFRGVSATDWVRPGINTNKPIWGIRGGLLWAIAPSGFREGEPRGLIRLGYPVLTNGGYDLINFIAIEPIVAKHRGFSELEQSKLDGLAGKRIWSDSTNSLVGAYLSSGKLERALNGTETLEVPLQVEAFQNGARIRLIARQRSERPDELELSIFKQEDSAAIDYCILTATMGNMARCRQLWLKQRLVTSGELYPSPQQDKFGFVRHREFPLSDLHQDPTNGVLVAITTDESNPASIYPFAGSESWHYAGVKVTQYWRIPPGDHLDGLQAVVNGRLTYWRSRQPIPGGIAFENFELREKFQQGQRFIFGITRATPAGLGL
jgi:hypothetical protein